MRPNHRPVVPWCRNKTTPTPAYQSQMVLPVPHPVKKSACETPARKERKRASVRILGLCWQTSLAPWLCRRL